MAKNYNLPDMQGHFGSYGGTFVAETLIAALEELRDQYEYYRNDCLLYTSPSPRD